MSRFRDDLDFDDEIKRDMEHGTKGIAKPVIICIAVAAVVLIIVGVIWGVSRKTRQTGNDGLAGTEEISSEDTETTEYVDVADTEDPELAIDQTEESGEEVSVAQILSASTVAENSTTTIGIDVAKYQGTIDWSKVAASGVEFAMIRVGYRTMETGAICADTNVKYNMQEAAANGIQIGAYFFSTAVTTQEAIEEADWVADYIAQYPITYPVAYNCEGFDGAGSRQSGLSVTERSGIASAFLDRIYERGYTPMFYASRNELAGDTLWDTSKLELSYKMWVAYYGTDGTGAIDYDGACAMWQYTNNGTVDGISKSVDIDIAYFGYDGTEQAKSDETPETVSADAEALMNFTEVYETVTAKSTTNLRDIPSQGSDATVMATLQNGQTAIRTGTSSSGWSRVEYNGNIYYAVSSYLTTDLTAPAQSTSTAQSSSDDGVKTKFTSCNDLVTAKIEVNLRTLPSVTNEESVVAATLHNGEVVTRTGINNEYGWSRVEYNGQTLYCISSYLTATE